MDNKFANLKEQFLSMFYVYFAKGVEIIEPKLFMLNQAKEIYEKLQQCEINKDEKEFLNKYFIALNNTKPIVYSKYRLVKESSK